VCRFTAGPGSLPRLHPNTCRYRLARAEQVFGIQLADPDQRLLPWLQLRLAPAARPAPG